MGGAAASTREFLTEVSKLLDDGQNGRAINGLQRFLDMQWLISGPLSNEIGETNYIKLIGAINRMIELIKESQFGLARIVVFSTASLLKGD